MGHDTPSAGPELAGDANHPNGTGGMDRRRGARPGDVRIRRTRESRRSVLRALRAVPNVIRRVNPFS